MPNARAGQDFSPALRQKSFSLPPFPVKRAPGPFVAFLRLFPLLVGLPPVPGQRPV